MSDIADPVPAPDQYVVAVHAAAMNFFDILQIQGKYQNQPPFPWVAGAEFAGTVVRVPAASRHNDSSRFKVGDRVFGSSQGAFAGKVACDERALHLVPRNWSFSDAAGLFVTAPTGYIGLVERGQTKQGD